jgi:polysaccharide biosynthesis transport protein
VEIQKPASRPTWSEHPVGEFGAEGVRFDFLGMLRRRKWLVMLCFAVGLGLGYLYYTKSEVIYESRGKVLIEARRPVTAAFNEENGIFEELDQMKGHHRVMASSEFLKEVVESNKLVELESFRGKSTVEVVMEVQQGLTTGFDKDQKSIFELAFRSPSKEDCKTVVNSILATYDKNLQERHKSVGNMAVELLQDDMQKSQDALVKLNSEYESFKASAPDGRAGEMFQKNKENVAAIELTIRESKVQLAEFETDLQWLRDAKADPAVDKMAIFLVLNREESDSTKDQLERMRTESGGPLITTSDTIQFEQRLTQLESELASELTRYGEAHPVIKRKRSEIQAYRTLVDRYVASLEAERTEIRLAQEEKEKELIQPGETEEGELLNILEQSLVQNVTRIKSRIANFELERVHNQNEVDKLVQFQSQDQAFQKNIAQREAFYGEVLKKFQELNLSKDDSGYNFQPLERASQAKQVEPSLAKVFGLASFLGLLVGLGLGYLVELADKTFHSPEDISNSLGLPLVGHIPVLLPSKRKQPKKDSRVDETVIAFHRPKSVLSEAYRAIRTALFFSFQGGNNKIIQITSPTPGDGKSTTAVNLAVSVAQSGKRVLIVDGDLRRPTLHYLLGINGEVGFASVLEGEIHAKEAIIETEVPGLFFMPCGPKPSNPAELLTSNRLGEVFDILREQFDLIIIDTPPMLAVTDPSAVAARVDGVILTIRIKKNVKLSADRSKGVLDAVHANVLGVVVNGVGSESSHYSSTGYSSPYYAYGGKAGYGYNYGYGYGYGYGAEGGRQYYQDEDGTEFVTTANSEIGNQKRPAIGNSVGKNNDA